MKPENKKFYRNLAVMVLPMAIQNLLTSLVSASDALMLGLLDQDALSAISLASQINFVEQIIVFGLVAGTSVLAAQYWGKKDEAAVEKVLGITLRYTLLGTSVLCLASLIFPQYLMRFFTNDPHLIELGIPYLRIVAVSHLFVAISQTYLTIMKTTDRVKRSSIFGSTTVILNIILNSLLIFGLFGLPKMEIAGAALATTISRGVEVLLCLIENRTKDVVRIRVRRIFESYPVHDAAAGQHGGLGRCDDRLFRDPGPSGYGRGGGPFHRQYRQELHRLRWRRCGHRRQHHPGQPDGPR